MTMPSENSLETPGVTGPRRVFLLGSPRSRTTVSQTVIAHACNLATMASTNWYLKHPSTQLLNGMEGMSRDDARRWACERISAHLQRTTSVVLADGFRLEEALDRLASETGAAGWLEKTPLNVLAIPEIESDIPGAYFIHLVRDPTAVVRSLLRRARDNPGMIGARHQSIQKNDEAVWRECIHATLQHYGKANHVVVDSESFVDDPEAEASRVAAFLGIPYRAPEHPERIRAAQATTPSHRPWKRDAAGPVRRIVHENDIVMNPLDAETESLWTTVQQKLRRAPERQQATTSWNRPRRHP